MFILTVILTLIVVPLFMLIAKCCICLKRFNNWLYRQIIFSFVIRYIIQSYYELALSVCINIQSLLYTTNAEIVASVISYFFGAICVFYPFIMLIFLLK